MQHTAHIVKDHRLSGLAVSAFRIRKHREAFCIHTGARDQPSLALYHMQPLGQFSVDRILKHNAGTATIRCLEQTHDQALLQFAAIQRRTETGQVIDHGNAKRTRCQAAVDIGFCRIGQYGKGLVLCKQFAVMCHQFGICHRISSSAVDHRIIIQERDVLHQFKFFPIRAGDQHTIVRRDQTFDQLLTEAIDIIIIIGQ